MQSGIAATVFEFKDGEACKRCRIQGLDCDGGEAIVRPTVRTPRTRCLPCFQHNKKMPIDWWRLLQWRKGRDYEPLRQSYVLLESDTCRRLLPTPLFSRPRRSSPWSSPHGALLPRMLTDSDCHEHFPESLVLSALPGSSRPSPQ